MNALSTKNSSSQESIEKERALLGSLLGVLSHFLNGTRFIRGMKDQKVHLPYRICLLYKGQ